MQGIIKTSIIMSVSVFAAVACSQDKVASTNVAESEPSPSSISAAPFDAAAADAAMQRPMDGSSVEAFTKDLERLKSEVRPEDFAKVQSALSWMMFYDLSAAGEKAKLYASLDGDTPNEIIAKSGRKDNQ